MRRAGECLQALTSTFVPTVPSWSPSLSVATGAAAAGAGVAATGFAAVFGEKTSGATGVLTAGMLDTDINFSLGG
jgi:hypothetical protein